MPGTVRSVLHSAVSSSPLASSEVDGHRDAWSRSRDIMFLPMYTLLTVVGMRTEISATLSEWVASVAAHQIRHSDSHFYFIAAPAVVLPADKYFHLFSSFWSPRRWLEAVLILKATSTLTTILPSGSTTLDYNQATFQHSPVQPPSSQSG